MAKDKETTPKPGAFVVVSPFRDKANFDLAYTAGQDVSDLADTRLAELVAADVVEVVQEPEKPAA